jgi:hypothetical protein
MFTTWVIYFHLDQKEQLEILFYYGIGFDILAQWLFPHFLLNRHQD